MIKRLYFSFSVAYSPHFWQLPLDYTIKPANLSKTNKLQALQDTPLIPPANQNGERNGCPYKEIWGVGRSPNRWYGKGRPLAAFLVHCIEKKVTVNLGGIAFSLHFPRLNLAVLCFCFALRRSPLFCCLAYCLVCKKSNVNVRDVYKIAVVTKKLEFYSLFPTNASKRSTAKLTSGRRPFHCAWNHQPVNITFRLRLSIIRFSRS